MTSSNSQPEKVSVLGYAIAARSRVAVVKSCMELIDSPECGKSSPSWLACLNPHSYCVARDDEIFARALHSATLLIPDGYGIVLASRALGTPVLERVSGYDVFCSIMQQLNECGGKRVFFLGSSQAVLCKIFQRASRDFPNVQLTGAYSPPFRESFSDSDTSEMIRRVNESRSDVLWVAMTAPKQEKWVFRNLEVLNVTFVGAVGAVFDFYAGAVARPPQFLQAIGLEWLFRLLGEPRRLWRRSFISAPVFVLDVLRQWYKNR